MVQDALTQLALPFVVLQRLPQIPQLFASPFVSVSQPLSGLPSQSWNDWVQATEQFPFEQLGTAWFVLH
jgi:hypothetical protein